ncbi:MAG: hypothetical protein AAF074_00365 [Pseudomonadota bacterium]
MIIAFAVAIVLLTGLLLLAQRDAPAERRVVVRVRDDERRRPVRRPDDRTL